MRTTRRDSRRITSTNRGSLASPGAIASAIAEGWTSASFTSRPSAFDTIFWPITSKSPDTTGVPWRLAASTISRAMSSPGRTSPMPSTPMTS